MQAQTDIESLLRQPMPQDVIGAIFAYSGLDQFTSSRRKLHEFLAAKKQGEGKDLLDDFVFSEGADPYPFSRLLESVLMQLQMGGWVSAKNPEYDKFVLDPQTREEIMKKVETRFSPEQLTVLKQIGNDFAEFVNELSKDDR